MARNGRQRLETSGGTGRRKWSTDQRLASLLPGAPGLLAGLRAAPQVAARLLSLGALPLLDALRHNAAALEPLVRTPEDVEALVELLASVARNPRIHAHSLLPRLPGAATALGSRSGAEALAFVRELCETGQSPDSQNQEVWMEGLKAFQTRFRPDLQRDGRWIARLMAYETIVAPLAGQIGSEAEAEEVERALQKLYATPMGYSDRDLDRKHTLAEVFARVAHLVRDVDGFVALCEAMPRIMEDLPEFSESTIYGYCHTYDLTDLGRRADNALDLKEFLSDAPVPDRPEIAQERRPPSPPKPPPAPLTPFERLLRQYRVLVSRIEAACYLMEGPYGRLESGRFFATHGQRLEPALRSDRDLTDLLAVVQDTQAYAPNLAGGVPPDFLDRFVEVKSELATRTASFAAGSPRLLRYLQREPRSAVRLLSLDDRRLLDSISAHLFRVDPLLEGKRDAPALVSLVLVLAFYDRVDVGELFGAMEAMRDAIGVPSSFSAFLTARELVTEAVPLRHRDDLLIRVRAVSEALPRDVTCRNEELARLVRFWRLARFVGPVIRSGGDVIHVRTALIEMMDRIRSQFFGETMTYGDVLLATWRAGLPPGYDRDEDIVAELEPLFAARAGDIRSASGLVELCRAMPRLYAASWEASRR